MSMFLPQVLNLIKIYVALSTDDAIIDTKLQKMKLKVFMYLWWLCNIACVLYGILFEFCVPLFI